MKKIILSLLTLAITGCSAISVHEKLARTPQKAQAKGQGKMFAYKLKISPKEPGIVWLLPVKSKD